MSLGAGAIGFLVVGFLIVALFLESLSSSAPRAELAQTEVPEAQ